MKVWIRLDHYKADPGQTLVLAIGNFDGVHTGHHEILKKVVTRGAKYGRTPAVLTFAEHPQRVLHHSPEPTLLTSPQHRLLLFQDLGIELCFLLPFTVEFSKTDAETFVRKWLVAKLGVKEVHLGYNAHFGFDRKGDAGLMRRLAKEQGFEFYESEPVKAASEFVSSSLIRQRIREGDLSKAGRLLGRPFSIFASVIRGKGRGKDLGYPTANLQPHSEILPPHGVYPVGMRESAFHLKPEESKDKFEFIKEKQGEWHQGILNYGTRPTFGLNGAVVPEVFLLDYSGDLYGKTVEVLFHPKLRDEKRFENSRELASAIEEDVKRATQYFKNVGQTGLYK